MNEGELVEAVAQRAGITQAEAKKIIDAFAQTIIDQLQKGKEVNLSGFGSFVLSRHGTKTTDESGEEKKDDDDGLTVVRFQAGEDLKKNIL